MLNRRKAALALSAALASSALSAGTPEPEEELDALRRRLGGRIGVTILSAGSGRYMSIAGDDAFPLCSTFKLLASALVLARVDRDEESLERRVAFGPEALVPNSPVTERRVGGDGMSLAEICRAAITRSDNTAGNLLLGSFGGPAALTAFARSLGDEATRLDRTEPTLNEALPGDQRDTTTPLAMARTVATLLDGRSLTPASREILLGWLDANETGGARIRAGTPAGWLVGDKTGTGERGAASDVAVLRPKPGAPPLVLAVYLHGSTRPLAELSGAIAEVARFMIPVLGPA